MYKKRFVPPWLMFSEEGGDAGGGTTPPAGQQDELGFPKDTPVASMTPEQQAAYWRHEAKKQQREKEQKERAWTALGKTPEEIQTLLADAEQARKEALSEQERALEAAREQARAEGVAQARNKFLQAAVEGQIVTVTRAAGESIEDAKKRVSDALAFVDLGKFLNTDGDLDAAKVQQFAETLGTSGANPQPGGFPLMGQLRQQQQPGPDAMGSVKAIQQALREKREAKTK